MAITTLDGAIAAAKIQFGFSLATISSMVAGTQASLWKAAGQYPPAATTPTSAAVPTDADSGYSFTNPTSPAKTYLHSIDLFAASVGQLIIYDRLSHIGSLSGTSTSSQTVNTSSINRGDTTGLNVEGFLEWYSATGATASNCTITYTNHANTSGQTGVIAIGGTAKQPSMMLPIPWASGTQGIRSVQSVQNSASTGTAGNFGVTLCRRLATIPVVAANTPIKLGPLELGLPEVNDDACLFLSWLPSTTSTGQINGCMVLAQG